MLLLIKIDSLEPFQWSLQEVNLFVCWKIQSFWFKAEQQSNQFSFQAYFKIEILIKEQIYYFVIHPFDCLIEEALIQIIGWINQLEILVFKFVFTIQQVFQFLQVSKLNSKELKLAYLQKSQKVG